MDNKLKQALIDGEIFVTSKALVRKAVREAIKYMQTGSSFYQESENISNEEIEDICDEVVDYLT